MHRNKEHREKTTSSLRPLHGLLAAAVAASIMAPVAFAGAADDPVATKSATSLRKQVKSLKKRVAALEGRQTSGGATGATATPVGPAKGDLTGTYPNPTIGPDKITSAKVANGTLTAADVAQSGLTGLDLGPGEIGDRELKGVHSVIGGGTTVANNTAATVTVACPPGEQLIAGGYAWGSTAAGLTVTANAPSGNPNEFFANWVVTGRNTSGSSAGLFPWASCLVN
jgi:hypothetical protein